MDPRSRTRTVPALGEEEAAAVRRLVADAAAADGGAPALNEAALLALRHPRKGVQHLLVPDEDGRLTGYAQLEAGEPTSTGQLLVAPGSRRRGVGTALLRRLLDLAPSRLQVWAVGDRPAARALAARAGLVPERVLLVMTRPLDETLREPRVPAGTTIRTFVPGQDEAAWLALNARAFASHPEQGSLTADDLAQRMAEPWFDPAGFFLAERDGTGAARAVRGPAPPADLLGFHWTKRHGGGLGEVYVLGVDPAHGGAGLGGALLDTGLRHLRDAGDAEVELYVEADHPRAVDLYLGRGFRTASRDVMYAQL